MNPELLSLAAAMLAVGLAGGVVAGLLGVGGGIIVVPFLEFALGRVGVDPAIRMQVAVATSLATIIPTSISSSRAHRRKGAIDDDLVARWRIPLFVGAAVGSFIAGHVHSAMLSGIFAVVAACIAVRMLLMRADLSLGSDVPSGFFGNGIAASIGGISTMMGIGGGTLSVPILGLYRFPIHRAVGTASLFGLFISLAGTIGLIAFSLGDPRLPPFSLGYVNLIGFGLIAPTSWLAAPWGARIAHGISKRQLTLAFGVFLAAVAIRMAWRAWAA